MYEVRDEQEKQLYSLPQPVTMILLILTAAVMLSSQSDLKLVRRLPDNNFVQIYDNFTMYCAKHPVYSSFFTLQISKSFVSEPSTYEDASSVFVTPITS